MLVSVTVPIKLYGNSYWDYINARTLLLIEKSLINVMSMLYQSNIDNFDMQNVCQCLTDIITLTYILYRQET